MENTHVEGGYHKSENHGLGSSQMKRKTLDPWKGFASHKSATPKNYTKCFTLKETYFKKSMNI